MKSTKFLALLWVCGPLLVLFQGCGTDPAGPAPLGTERAALGVMCTLVPGEYVGASDGCDCPSDGDTTCDPDCAVSNQAGGYCGCEYCYPEEPPPPGQQCGLIPAEYLDASDGCDCPSNGNQACDPDCAEENAGGAYCGCEYCYPEEPPPPSGTVYIPPAEGAAFGIPGAPPSAPVNALISAQVAGRVPGGGGVTRDGAYTYSVPIALPPGRAGMNPQVSLDYDSRAGNGLVGMGWRLSAGQSVITRCGKQHASGYRANTTATRVRQTDGLTFTTGDPLCLDGQRLELVAGTQGVGGSEYRTEVDQFAKVVALGSASGEPDSFKVHHKDGLIGTYSKHGGTNAGGTALTGFHREGSGSPVTLLWARTLLEDRAGNAIKYTWTKENTTVSGGEQSMPRLTDIDYTTCVGGGCPYGSSGLRKIKFSYQGRSDARVVYTNGVRIDEKQRLFAIDVFGDAGAPSPNWTYSLVFHASWFTGRSLLERISQCLSANCLPSTTFEWQEAGKNQWTVAGLSGERWEVVQPGQSGFAGTEPNATEMTFVVFDADGDGHQDFIAKEWPTTSLDASSKLVRDVATLGIGPVDWLALSNRNGGFLNAQPVDLEGDGHPQASARCTGTGSQAEIADLSSTIALDLDMDGREELFAPLNTGCPFQFAPGATTNGMRNTPGLSLVAPNVNTQGERVFAVLNYDRASSVLKRRATPLPFFNAGFWDHWRYSFADLTGNGLPDVLYGPGGATDPVKVSKAVFMGSGETQNSSPEIAYALLGTTLGGYDTGLRYSWQQQNSSARTPNSIRVLDENGDGRSELLQLSYDGDQRGFGLNAPVTQAVRSYRNAAGTVNWVQPQNLDGTGGTPPNQWPAYPGPNAVTLNNGAVMSWRYADINGDGLKDAIYSRRMPGDAFPWFYRLNTGNGYLPEQELVVSGSPNWLWYYGAASEITIVNGVVRVPQDVGLRIADMNGDGRDDLVALDTTNGAVLYSNGSGFEFPVELPSRGTGASRIRFPYNVMRWPVTQLADMDGDGLNDLVEWVVDPGNAKKRVIVTVRRVLPNGHDVVTGVTDGLGTGFAESVEYKSLSDQSFHVSDARFAAGTNGAKICRYPARCVSTGKAVSRYQNFRSFRAVDTRFRYAGARTDVTGRGWLGFREVKITDAVTGIETTRTYDQVPLGNVVADSFHLYPMLETPATTVTLYAGGHDASLAEPDGSHRRSRTTTTWTPTFNGTLPLRITRSVSTTTLADVNSIYQTTPFAEDRARYVTDLVYGNDQYGNLTSSTQTAQDLGALALDATLPNITTTRTKTLAYVAPDTANWLVGLPSRETQSSTSNDAVCQGLAGCASATSETTYEYETTARKLLRKATRQPNGGASQMRVTVFERDEAGLVRRVRVRDGAGSERVSEVDFDATGYYPVTSRNAVGHVSFRQFNKALGLVDRDTDPNGAFVSYLYDNFGRVRRTNRSDGDFEIVSYGRTTESSNIVNSITVTTASGDDAKVFLDARGRTLLTLTPGFNATAGGAPATTTTVAAEYDALGNAVETSYNSLSQPYGSAVYATYSSLAGAHAVSAELLGVRLYDTLGRISQSDKGDPNQIPPSEGASEHRSVRYPRHGEVLSLEPSTNGLFFESRVISDARGNVRRRYDGSSATTSPIPTDYTYTALGRLAKVAPSNSPAETFSYDALGRPTAWMMGGSANARTTTYTAFDEVDIATEAGEMSTKFVYDRLGRAVSRTKTSSTAGTELYTFEWDTSPRHDGACAETSGVVLGTLALASGPDSEVRTLYDALGRPCKIRQSFDVNEFTGVMDVGMGYDAIGRVSSIRYPNVKLEAGAITPSTQPALAIQYRFATNGQLSKVVDTTNTAVDLYTITDRHPLGMLERAVNSGGMANAFQYQTNTLRMKEAAVTTAQSAVVAAETFVYHQSGLLKSRTYGSSAQETYGYGSVANRLTDYMRSAASAVQVDVDYAYGTSGNITTLTTNTAVAPDFGPAGTLAFGYGSGDASGGGIATTYTDLLTTIDPSTVGASGTISYGYDTAGRQRTKFVGGVKKRTITGYNAFNLPTQIDVQDGGTLIHRTNFQYDPFGNRSYKQRVTPSASDQSVLYVGKFFEAQKFLDGNTTPATQVQRLLCRVYAEGRPIAEVFPNSNGTKRTQFLYADDQGSVNYRTEGTATVEASGSSGTPSGFRGFSPFGKRWSASGASAPLFASVGYTGHSHDDDLGLINMNGRVYDVEQHRFISRDPLMAPYALGGTNAYAYVLGNPTNLTDPSGYQACDDHSPGCQSQSPQANPIVHDTICFIAGFFGYKCVTVSKPGNDNHTPDNDRFPWNPPSGSGGSGPPPPPRCGDWPCAPDGQPPGTYVGLPPAQQAPSVDSFPQGVYFGDDVGTPASSRPSSPPAAVPAAPPAAAPAAAPAPLREPIRGPMLVQGSPMPPLGRAIVPRVWFPGVNMDAHVSEAAAERAAHRYSGYYYYWFFDRVRYQGAWDYKSHGEIYEPFGNFHYGVTGAAMGLSLIELLQAAGAAQIWRDRNDDGPFVKPGHGAPGLFGLGGTPPYGDFPIDQYWIRQGFLYYYQQYVYPREGPQ